MKTNHILINHIHFLEFYEQNLPVNPASPISPLRPRIIRPVMEESFIITSLFFLR